MSRPHLRPQETKSLHRIHLRDRRIKIETPMALIVAPETMVYMDVKEWVTGLVVPNPFSTTGWTSDKENAHDLKILEGSE